MEAEYCRALFIVTSLKVTFSPFFSSMVADRKGNVLGLGAPPAKEMREGGERCCSSALQGRCKRDEKETQNNKVGRFKKKPLQRAGAETQKLMHMHACIVHR